MKTKKRAKPSGPVTKTRKTLRKEMRKQKKARRNEYYTNRNKGDKTLLTPNKQPPQTNKLDKPKQNSSPNPKPNKNVNQQKVLTTEEIQRRTLQKERREQQRLQKEMAKQRKKQLQKANDEEDRNIKFLEKQLNLNKRKSKSTPKSFTEDGLDYLLEICDSDNMKAAVATEQQLNEINDDFEEDLALMTGKSLKKRKLLDEEDDSDIDMQDSLSMSDDGVEPDDDQELDEAESDDDQDLDEVESGDDREESETEADLEDLPKKVASVKATKLNQNSPAKKRRKSESMSSMEDTIITDDEKQLETDSEGESNTNDNKSEIDAKEQGEVWEDIYGRMRSKDGHVITEKPTKYIPPAIRAKMAAESPEDKKREEKLSRLRRQLKGLLNRLAESNMHNIAAQIEDLYMNNSRNDMNDTLTSLIFDSIVTNVLTPERLLLEHVMLITVLHANVGTEVGAHFLQTVIKKFSELYNAEYAVENKMIDNVVWVIAQLYNYKVFHVKLIYEILVKLSTRFTETDIECILLVLKSVGFSLRKDDPLALKNLILDLQKQANAAGALMKENQRVKFMLEILLAIKNNNMSKIPNYDTSYSEHLKKLLKGFVRKGCYVTTLNISLEDLLKADEYGKWWVVGSAWSGKTTEADQDNNAPGKLEGFSQKLLDLARKQRMNTDTRRSVFCIIMSAEDYLDAFEKLLHLNLKNQQEREIVHVILHCCLQEKAFNQYYAVLAQKFCEYDRKFQMTIKYSVWDKLKALTECSATQLSNLAKLLTHLFLEKGLPISTLKIVQFGELDKITLRFMRQILIGILLCDDEEACQGVFTNVAQSDKLKMFRESLKLFIQHFLLRNLKSESVPEAQKTLLEIRAKMVDKILSVSDKKIRF